MKKRKARTKEDVRNFLISLAVAACGVVVIFTHCMILANAESDAVFKLSQVESTLDATYGVDTNLVAEVTENRDFDVATLDQMLTNPDVVESVNAYNESAEVINTKRNQLPLFPIVSKVMGISQYQTL